MVGIVYMQHRYPPVPLTGGCNAIACVRFREGPAKMEVLAADT
jgi:hypothetical protein